MVFLVISKIGLCLKKVSKHQIKFSGICAYSLWRRYPLYFSPHWTGEGGKV